MSIAEPGSERVGLSDSVGNDGDQQEPKDLADDSGKKKGWACGCFKTFCESECYWPNC